ncbi:arylesterase [Aureimonas endophytica]|uniref:Arylesterase n=2 Tax=Aureimonas endophytica TaxID=2027858 RepID=A0A916ZGM3_9HYPH|nr:arylesterase [Aureimonas endophytica]GGD96196.1 arylesterase [Aureimonas endophytica]
MTHRFQAFRAAVTALLFLAASAGARAEEAKPAEIVAFGDSLSAGFGVGPGESFPEQLQAALTAKNYAVTVANAGVSGDTTTGGLQRLEWSVPPSATLVILELGANDALRGITPQITEANLDEMLQKLKARGTRTLFAGMLAPPNMGEDYAAAFNPIYPRLAQRYGVAFYPFFLDGVAGERGLNQADGMHPTKAGVALIVQRLLPLVEEELKAAGVVPHQG